jgi:hypothetical protein
MYRQPCGSDAQWWSCHIPTDDKHDGAINLNFRVAPARPPAHTARTNDHA